MLSMVAYYLAARLEDGAIDTDAETLAMLDCLEWKVSPPPKAGKFPLCIMDLVTSIDSSSIVVGLTLANRGGELSTLSLTLFSLFASAKAQSSSVLPSIKVLAIVGLVAIFKLSF